MPDKPAPKPAPSPFSVNGPEAIVLGILLLIILGGLGFATDFFGGDSVIGSALREVHRIVTMVASVISMIAIAIAVYSYMRLNEIISEETKKLGLALSWHTERAQKNARWDRVETYMTSLNPSDWKIAILEADNILDQVVERMGYAGTTLGERMKHIEASDFPYLDDAWNAHKTRNAIAHKGTDYELSRSQAEQTINIYHRVFKELGYL
jgi:hypothetical protein